MKVEGGSLVGGKENHVKKGVLSVRALHEMGNPFPAQAHPVVVCGKETEFGSVLQGQDHGILSLSANVTIVEIAHRSRDELFARGKFFLRN